MYTSYSSYRTPEYVRTYRTILQDLSKRRILPKALSKSQLYSPSSTVTTQEASPVFVPLFYAGEKGALGIWEKEIRTGFVKRRVDEDDRSYHVLEMSNPRNNLGTFISAPKSVLHALHITLPHIVMVMKHYRRNFAFEVLVMDSNAYRRRFSFATWYNPSLLKKYSFLCQVPLRLEIGWNEIHVNLNELVSSAYRTSYVETLRVRVYANCKLRQIFFCDDRMVRGDIPVPSMRDFSNFRFVALDYGPRMHPDALEHGPEKLRQYPYNDPPIQVPPTRLEKDLNQLMRKRYTDVSKLRLSLQPYKTYFRELIQEEKHKRKIAEKVQATLRAELAKKTIVEQTATELDETAKVQKVTAVSSENEGPPILVTITESPEPLKESTLSVVSEGSVKPDDVKEGTPLELQLQKRNDGNSKKTVLIVDINKLAEGKVLTPPSSATGQRERQSTPTESKPSKRR